jgi:hypothetical protein
MPIANNQRRGRQRPYEADKHDPNSTLTGRTPEDEGREEPPLLGHPQDRR